MYPLLSFLFDLTRLRRAPQDLPASWGLFGLILALNLPIGLVGTTALFGGLGPALQAYLVDVVVVIGLLGFALKIAVKPARFAQTATAYFGVSLIIGLATLPLHLLAGVEALQGLVALAQLALVAWAHVAFGHVLRHALELDLWLGVVIAVGFTLVELSVVYQVVPPTALNGG